MDLWWRLLQRQSSDRQKQSKEQGQLSAAEEHPAVVEPAHHHHNAQPVHPLHSPAAPPQLRAGLTNLNTNDHNDRPIEPQSKNNSDPPVSTSAPAPLYVPFVPSTPLRTSLFSLASPCSLAYSTDSSPVSLSLAYSDYDTELMALSTPELLDTRRQHGDNIPKALTSQKGDIVADPSSDGSQQYVQRASGSGMMPDSTPSTNMYRATRPPSLDVQLSRQKKRLSLLGRPSPAYGEATSARSSLASPTQRNHPVRNSSSSRLLPGLGLPDYPRQRYTYHASGGLRTSPISEDAPSGGELASEISAAILKETEENAAAEQPSTTLKIWGAVARCLEEITVSLGPPNSNAPAVSAPPSIAYAPQLRATPSIRRMSNSVQSVGSRRTSYDVGARNDLPSRHRRVISSSSIRSGRQERDLEATYAMDGQGMEGYSCPFRVRNPVRFNIRDHEVCAMTSFESLADLRHHVMSYHRRRAMPHQCQRCKVGFPTQKGLDEHLMLPKDEMCDTVPTETPRNPEDGISEDVDRTLASGDGIRTWDNLWRLIFPLDDQIPSSDFHPVIELAEVEQQFDEGQEALKTHLQETLRLFLPEAIDDAYRNFLTGQLELVFEAHKANTIRKCLHRIHGSTNNDTTGGQGTSPEDKRRRSSSGAGNVNLARRSTRRNRQSAIFSGSRAQERQSSSTSDGLFSPSLLPPWQSRRGSNGLSNISNNNNKPASRRMSDNTRSRPNLTSNPPTSPRRLSPHPTPTLSVSATVATNESDDTALKSPTTPASSSGSAPLIHVAAQGGGASNFSISPDSGCACTSPSTCRCNELLALGIHHNSHNNHYHGHPPARPKTAPIPYRERMEELSVLKHRLRHQPALQVRTTGIDLNGGLEGRRAWTGDVRMYDEEDSDDDEDSNNVFLRPKTRESFDLAFRGAMSARDVRESYSPQSFKERLLSRGSSVRGVKQLEVEDGVGEETQGQELGLDDNDPEGTSSQRGSWMG
ncbi:hypothetical protein NCU05648 [Neurospora crassa OR74A]|uniref:C2H2-type domain-containing protein n=1 Tax=Neurospora crassa (strain ATCC 24698 / 74-OR23-1A / CBS 708.71 / DSM 1257 / FGSC 987) TaxID=367110 RepID=Q7S612_NEUCR|nr:hypothetical protein NCU05648 [Neurospora crassa OR74A]EAA30973.2 hypothetical protein NCU05648 [Neurospora crassa OR74A]|eukprot:XP_960209.2 hypothetical protein NCU05648 [Neurospora crassa OR74A]